MQKKTINSVLFICMGNICRSPAAHAVMEQVNREQALSWNIDSCGTCAYHQGAAPDSRMQKVLHHHGYQGFRHAAKLFQTGMAYEFDLLLAMDLHNYDDIYELLSHDADLSGKLHLFRDFDPEVSEGQRAEVPDPYYNGAKSFEEVYRMIVRTCTNLAAQFGAQ
ncbi:low molecular weight phosphotyrosine protein phosphatase [Candidatus Haliotispira prima]|uniref:protein-tyrosine-phosphatase n=1 Tax=Candidatus Haliotispira prima TaxID=3034016 RepID=A0ABY8MJI0_9SPIO|nr:low molecular weight phosphotyrosine protein phosphatase [Candidatus Haliotispira prima]